MKTWSDNVNVRPSTLELYQSHLYWSRCLNSKYTDIETWLSRVKEQLRSEEKDIVNEWASDLQRFFKTYTVKNTGRTHWHVGANRRRSRQVSEVDQVVAILPSHAPPAGTDACW